MLDAAEVILREAGEPLRPREITERVLERGLWETTGLTPVATVTAGLAVDVRDRGANSRFIRPAPGRYAINTGYTQPPDTPPDEATPARRRVARATSPPTRPPRPPVQGRMSFLDAAENVLRRSQNQAPMHYRAITDQALAEGLVESAGQTPEATVRAQIGLENRRRESRGQRPRFLELGRGLIGLSDWQQQGVLLEIERHNEAQRAELLDRVRAMDPRGFENLIGELLSRLDFEISSITSYGGDRGVDVRALVALGGVMRVKVAVQVKRWANNVRAPTVRELRGSLGAHERGLVITTSNFSGGAREEADRMDALPVALMNGDELVALMVQTKLGVHRSAYDVIELAETLPGRPDADAAE
jgi:restriction system protein